MTQKEVSFEKSSEDSDEKHPLGECRLLIWQCFSKVLENGMKHIKGLDDIYNHLTPILYKAVFHGGLKSMWSSVMEVKRFFPGIIDHHICCILQIPQMHRMGECISEHDKCVETNVLKSYI